MLIVKALSFRTINACTMHNFDAFASNDASAHDDMQSSIRAILIELKSARGVR